MQYFCTLFNSAYLSRGLAMYYSLLEQSQDFHLYIYAFDDTCSRLLGNLNLTHATVVSLPEFETEELLAVKESRSACEYCWTCTPFTIWHAIHTYNLDHCTYLDADLLFFSDPKVLTDEMGAQAVLITEHRYSPEHDQSALSGVYCVQFITFKSTEQGMRVLDWWRKACLEWCYKRFEDGKFGDQKYLDDWTTRFEGVHVLKHIGGGVAPWNNREYEFRKKGNRIQVVKAGEEAPLVFYHFHDFRYCADKVFRLTAEQYALKKTAIDLVYRRYARALEAAERSIGRLDPVFVFHEPLYPLHWVYTNLGRRANFLLRGAYKNYYKQSKLC